MDEKTYRLRDWTIHFWSTTLQGVTCCTVHRGGNRTFCSQNRPCVTKGNGVGFTILNLTDKVHTATGRKVALSRALTAMSLTKSDRCAIWTEYLIVGTGRGI